MRKLAVTYPWSSPFSYTGFVEQSLNIKHPEGWEVRWFRGDGWCVARMHNHGVEQALDWDADAICFLDPDQVHPENILEVLVDHLAEGREVVGALVPLRMYLPWNGMKPFQSMAWCKDDGVLRRIREEDGDVQEVHSIGTGVLMVKASLVEGLRPPWFYERIDEHSFNRFGGSDTRFVGRLRDELGVKIWADTTIRVGHLKIFPIDETFSDRFSDYPAADVTNTAETQMDREDRRGKAQGFGGWAIDKSCYQRIRELVPAGGTILEFGSGVSTDKLEKHYTVHSIEENEDRMHGENCTFAPIKDGWYDVGVVESALPEDYDLILVDGPVTCETAGRLGFVDNHRMFNLDVPIVFDDVNRPADDLAMQLVARITERTPEIHRGSDKDFGVLL